MAAETVEEKLATLKTEVSALSSTMNKATTELAATTKVSSETSGKVSVLVGGSLAGLVLTVGGLALLAARLSEQLKDVDTLRSSVQKAISEAESGKAQLEKQKAEMEEEYKRRIANQTPPPPPQPPVVRAVGKLQCITKEARSGHTTYPSVTVTLTQEEQKEYVVTGGGCKTLRAGEGAPHNIPTIRSAPSESGWSCAAGDPPSLPVDSEIWAYVIACAVK